jgi:hypothetical protein
MASRSLAVLLWTFWALAGAQQSGTPPVSQTQKCVVEGTATDANTAEVLHKVAVHLSPGSNGHGSGGDTEYSTTIDASGHFRFENVRSGDYMLEGEHAGYLNSYFGARKPAAFGTIVHLSAGDKLSELQLKLWPRCVVSGKVVDENGQPVSAQIYAIAQLWFRGQRRYFERSYFIHK